MKDYPNHACCGPGAAPLDLPLEALIGAVKRLLKQEDDTVAQTIQKSAKDLVKEALAAVPAVSVEDALPLVDSQAYVFVDLRDGTEQARTGIIPAAVASSRGMLEFHIDPESPAHIPALNQDKTYIFYCASGGRSALAAQVAMEMGLSPVMNLTGGVAAWKKAGGELDGGSK